VHRRDVRIEVAHLREGRGGERETRVASRVVRGKREVSASRGSRVRRGGWSRTRFGVTLVDQPSTATVGGAEFSGNARDPSGSGMRYIAFARG
jgi:hypothetical protein